jgi:hypothetical protein
MKRAVIVGLGLAVACAAVWGLATYGPYGRWYLRVRWRAIEASRREPAALAEWRKEFGDPADALPTHDDNATVSRLAVLGPDAGVNFTGQVEWTASEQAISTYVTAESMKTGGPVSPPPDVVRAYLDAHQRGLGAVVDLLTRSDPPAWKTDQWHSAPLFAVKALSNVLVAEALAQSSRGHGADAERALLASWQLNASARDDPGIVAQALADAMATIQASLARRLPIDPVAWRVRLGDRDYRASMLQALVIDASRKRWGTSQMGRAAHADYLDLMRAFLVQVRSQPVTTLSTSMEFRDADAMRDGWSAGTTVAMIARPGLYRAWLTADDVMLQFELTDRVLRARELKAQLGRWPAAIPDLETSRFADVHWVYRVSPDGRISIALRPTLQVMPRPPLRFESHE